MSEPRDTHDITAPPMPILTSTFVLVGMGLFALALVATLLVPDWHTGDHDWWPWCAGTGLFLGVIGYAYLRRGRGNAAYAGERD